MKKLIMTEIIVAILISSTLLSATYATALTWNAGVQINGQTTDKEWEPHIVAKRGSSSVLASGIIQTGINNCVGYRSTNTGSTWTQGSFGYDPKSGRSSGGDPVIASYANGTLLYACLGITSDSNGKLIDSVVTIGKSTNDGSSWSLKNTITPSDYGAPSGAQMDKAWLAIDRGADTTYKNRVYLCWTQFDYTAHTTKIYFGRINLGASPDFVSGTVKEIASATWTDDVNRYKGPFVQGCQLATGPGLVGSGNEIFLTWEYMGTSSGVIKFIPNYTGGAFSGWGSYFDVGTITRFSDQTSCKVGNVIQDGCLPGNLVSFRAAHIPAITIDKTGNPHVAWTSYLSSNANIMYNSAYNAGAANKSPVWNSAFQLTSSSDSRDQWDPAINVYEDSSTRGTVVIAGLNDVESTSNFWKPWAYHCHPTANTGTGSCHASGEWAAQKISDNDTTNNLDKFVGDYHGVASTTTRTAIDAYAWGRYVFANWIVDDLSYSTTT